MEIYRITRESLHLFRPYLLPEASAAIADGDPDILALGAVRESHSVGAILGQQVENTLYIRSLYVDESARRCGIGTALLRRLLSALPGARRVSVSYVAQEQGTLSAFLRAAGFPGLKKRSAVYCISLGEMRTVPVIGRAFQPEYRYPDEVTLLYRLPESVLAELLGDPAIPDYLHPEAYRESAVEPLCLAYRQGGRAAAYIILTRAEENALLFSAAYSRRGAPSGAFLQLVMAAVSTAAQLYEDDLSCWISAVNQLAVGLVRRMTGIDRAEFTEFGAILELNESC
jgi:ribosomal protein S18 acetylase RimI-like enzyme